MSQLDDQIDEWIAGLRTSQPELEPHLDEIADHVRTGAQARLDAGLEPAAAFAAALAAFGAPRDVAREFMTAADPARRLHLISALLPIVAALVFVAVLLTVDHYDPLSPQALQWITIAWVVTSALPYVLVQRFLARH